MNGAGSVRSMFDRIAPTYDLLNHLMSLGLDRSWRARAVAALQAGAPSGPLLDLCAGTLDLTALIARARPHTKVVACDFAADMLERGRHKAPTADIVVGDALSLPFADRTFAGVICGFGMRNLASLERGLGEVHRVLHAGGTFVTLEFFRPEHRVTRVFHATYAEQIMPRVGGFLSGDRDAYAYLASSMKAFRSRREYEELLAKTGFTVVRGTDLTLGVASIVTATRGTS